MSVCVLGTVITSPSSQSPPCLPAGHPVCPRGPSPPEHAPPDRPELHSRAGIRLRSGFCHSPQPLTPHSPSVRRRGRTCHFEGRHWTCFQCSDVTELIHFSPLSSPAENKLSGRHGSSCLPFRCQVLVGQQPLSRASCGGGRRAGAPRQGGLLSGQLAEAPSPAVEGPPPVHPHEHWHGPPRGAWFCSAMSSGSLGRGHSHGHGAAFSPALEQVLLTTDPMGEAPTCVRKPS